MHSRISGALLQRRLGDCTELNRHESGQLPWIDLALIGPEPIQSQVCEGPARPSKCIVGVGTRFVDHSSENVLEQQRSMHEAKV
jgi:hypothetical protein